MPETNHEASRQPFLNPNPNQRNTMKTTLKRFNNDGKIGWALLWLLGIPLPVLLIFYLLGGGH